MELPSQIALWLSVLRSFELELRAEEALELLHYVRLLEGELRRLYIASGERLPDGLTQRWRELDH